MHYTKTKGVNIMSFPNIPPVSPAIDIDIEDVISLLLASIAFEELGLAHIINAEAEKIQFVLGTLTPSRVSPPLTATIEDLIKIDQVVESVLKTVIKQEMLLQFKLEEVLSISTSSTTTSTTTTTTTTTPPV